MPRTDIQDSQTFQRFQGIDTRDDAENNTAYDMMNVALDDAGRLTNAPLPAKITTDANTEDAIWAFHALSDDGSEVNCNIDEYVATPVATVAVTNDTTFKVKLTAGSATFVNRIVVVTSVAPAKVLTDGLDFTVGITGSTITCVSSGANFLTCGIAKVLLWFPTTMLELAP